MSVLLLSGGNKQFRIVAFGKQGLYVPLRYAQTKPSSCICTWVGVLHSLDSPSGRILSMV